MHRYVVNFATFTPMMPRPCPPYRLDSTDTKINIHTRLTFSHPSISACYRGDDSSALTLAERVDDSPCSDTTIGRNEAGISMKTKQDHKSALSLGERVARDGVLSGRRRTGEGSLGSPRRGANRVSYARTEGNEAGMSMKRKEGWVAQTCSLGLRLFRRPTEKPRTLKNRSALPLGHSWLSRGW